VRDVQVNPLVHVFRNFFIVDYTIKMYKLLCPQDEKDTKNVTDSLAAESFRAAFRHLLDGRGRGSQAEFAESMGLHRSAVNDILNGRRGTSVKTQERVAAYFGLSLGEMLRIGEHLLNGRVVFPWTDQLEGLTKGQQVRRIVELTNEQVGHSQDNLTFIKHVCEFLDGKLTPAEIYQSYLKMIRPRIK
jgi:transcriptional regulator with XRE-family HTH domain